MSDIPSRLAAALADRYRIERELGKGGMATVYLAHDVKHNRRVAVKVLRPELSAILGAERFLKEIEVTANLQHPNILPLYDSGEARVPPDAEAAGAGGGNVFLYYVMPYVEGESLRDRLDREKQLAVDDAVEIARAVAGALDFAHQRGVIHRDIKPENILLQAGQALVADFGIALALSAAGGGTRLTETGLSLGTPHYMSPEQAAADRELDGRTDVYSLGAVLYEMLVGQPVFTAGSAQAIVAKVLTETPTPVSRDRPSVPPHVDAAVAVSLAKLPADRFSTTAAFAAALVNPGFTSPVATPATGGAGGGSVANRARHWAITAGVGALALVAGLLLRGGTGSASEVVRLHLYTPPEHAIFVQNDENAPFAISPDGHRIVYSALDSTTGEAQLRLFLRRIDQQEAVPVPGTEDAIAPFFSPEGNWIGFATEQDEQLKKVPLAGGPAVTLAGDVGEAAGGGSWGDDGYIVYTSTDYGLSRVRATGGDPELITRDTVPDEGMFWPWVLPGGDAVLFEWCRSQCAQTDLAVLDVASGTIDVVVPGATQGWFVAGYLLYATTDGDVYGVRFDPSRRAVSGTPTLFFPGVRQGSPSGSRFAASPAGTMMYIPGVALRVPKQLVEVTRSGRETPVGARTGDFETPRWSPDGRRIAMTIDGQIWIYDVSSETLSQLTFEDANFRPTWSPDGARVAFYSRRSDEWDLYWAPADFSGTSERVAEGEDTMNGSTTFWSRDGRWIIVDGWGDPDADDQDIFAIGTGDDRTRRTVVSTEANEEAGAVSPNGEWIAYSARAPSGQPQVYIRAFLAEGGRWLISTGVAVTPLWASDTEVVYVDVPTRTMMAATLEFGTTVRVAQRTPLFDLGPYTGIGSGSPGYDISRDGERLLMLRAGSARRVDPVPVVVLHWFAEAQRLMAEQGK
jgi:Tol biopolymer transport system component/predicted Ser/Thr protein kinase